MHPHQPNQPTHTIKPNTETLPFYNDYPDVPVTISYRDFRALHQLAVVGHAYLTTEALRLKLVDPEDIPFVRIFSHEALAMAQVQAGDPEVLSHIDDLTDYGEVLTLCFNEDQAYFQNSDLTHRALDLSRNVHISLGLTPPHLTSVGIDKTTGNPTSGLDLSEYGPPPTDNTEDGA